MRDIEPAGGCQYHSLKSTRRWLSYLVTVRPTRNLSRHFSPAVFKAEIKLSGEYGGPKGRLSRLMPSSLTTHALVPHERSLLPHECSLIPQECSLLPHECSLVPHECSLTNVSRKLLKRVLRLRDIIIIIIIIIIITLQPYKNILIQQMRISERRKWLTVNIT